MKQETRTIIRLMAAIDDTITSDELSAICEFCEEGYNGTRESHREFISAETASDILGVSRATFHRMEKLGKVKGINVSARKKKYAREEISALLRCGKQ